MAGPTPVVSISTVITDATVDDSAGEGQTGGVPSTRQIIAGNFITINGGSSHNLSSDVTVSGTTTPVNATTVVGSGRLLIGTAPVTINGGASHDHTADLTIAVATFSGSGAGLVPGGSSGNQALSLRGDGTWQSGTTAGVTSVAAGAGIAVSASTGSVTISGVLAGLTTAGDVPATGSADSTYFLCRTNPISWQQFSAAGFVQLQGSFPGSVQTGNVDITGTLGAQTRIVAGGTTILDTAVITADGDGSVPGFSHLTAAGTASGAWFAGFKARGTLGSPTATQNNDNIAAFTGSGYNTVSGYFGNPLAGMYLYADGNALTSTQPVYLDIYAGAIGSTMQARLSSSGMRVGAGGFMPSDRALSNLDVQGSLGLKIETKTTGFTVGDVDCFHQCDATGGGFNASLPTAVGRAGRVYGFTKVDETVFRVVFIIPTGGQLIDGLATGIPLYAKGETAFVISDGSNWWSFARSLKTEQTCQLTDTTIANLATEQVLGNTTNWNLPAVGGVQWSRFAGKYSTVSTPTMRFRVYDQAGPTLMADSGAITMPNVTNQAWQVSVRAYTRSLSGGNPTSRLVEAFLKFAGSTGQMTEYSMFSSFADLVGIGRNGHQLSIQFGTASSSNTITCTAAQGGSTDHSPVL